MDKKLSAAVVQMRSTTEVSQNIASSTHWVLEAVNRGATLVVLPENFGFLGDDKAKLPHAQEADGPFVKPLSEIARQHGVYILAGSIPEAGPDNHHTYNTSVMIGPEGVMATYRKIHLFDVDIPEQVTLRESDSVASGTDIVCCPLGEQGWKLGMSVCYDLRFPELYRQLERQGANLISIPAAFTLQTGKDHWETLVRARAIENQAYVLAAGQWGHHMQGRTSWGKSMIVDPWGTILACVGEHEGVAVAELNLEQIERVRKAMPCAMHRRIAT